MKLISVIVLSATMLTCCGQQRSTVGATFSEFKKAVVSMDCQLLCDLSEFPIESDAGLARLIDNDSWDELSKEMTRRNHQITEELLMSNCQLLDSIEVEVLKQSVHHDYSKDEGLVYDECKYKSHLRISEDGMSFSWSVGCQNRLDGMVGEYSLVFAFEKVKGEFKLTRIYGVG